MQHARNNTISKLSNKIQIITLLIGLAGIIIAIFVGYDFMNFLTSLKQGDPLPVAVLVATIGIGFVLLHKLGIDFAYKEEIGRQT